MSLETIAKTKYIPNSELLSSPSPLFILGTAHAGKSELASSALDPQRPALVVGTAENLDEAFASRINYLKGLRSKQWTTVENPTDLLATLKDASGKYPQIMIDSLNQYFASAVVAKSNRYSLDQLEDHLDYEVGELCSFFSGLKTTRLVLVSSEIAGGLAPSQPSGRLFRQIVSTLNRKIASLASSVIMVSAGIPIQIK